MKKHVVMGVHAPAARLTLPGLFLLASALALPVGALLWLVERLMF